MENLVDTITEALREKVNAGTLDRNDMLLADWLSEYAPPMWVYMIAGASQEAFDFDELYAALIDEVKAAME